MRYAEAMSNNEQEDDRPNLEVPDHLEYSDEHVWVDASVDPAVIGITEYAANQLGDLVFVDLPEVGTRVEAGDEIVELESSKAVEPLVSPVAGTVRYVNPHSMTTSRICCPPSSMRRCFAGCKSPPEASAGAVAPVSVGRSRRLSREGRLHRICPSGMSLSRP